MKTTQSPDSPATPDPDTGPVHVTDDEPTAAPTAEDIVSRILSRHGTALASTAAEHERRDADDDGALEREARAGTRRVASLSTELEDVSEVEYRQVRLEKVVLVGLELPTARPGATPGAARHGAGLEAADAQDAETSLAELAALAETAGSEVMDALIQKRDHPDPATYLGSGKAQELAEMVAAAGADTVIVDGELAPSQRRALEDVVKVKVVDRTAVILDIFAQHAKSREGKAQVELAQLEYLLPRLRGWGESMSRQAGGRVAAGAGIGSRGPGETKIELDRRRIRDRMARLRREIKAMAPSREVKRGSRRRGPISSVAIAGYTNAGKSSLMNRLTDAGLMVQDALFATLDPTVRRAEAADGRVYTLTDTVGFVRNLPHELIEAFRSTLEEVAGADVLVHVVDAAHPDPLSQIAAVREVLKDIPGALDVPELIVLNKADLADAVTLAALRTRLPQAVVVSARTGEGVDEMRRRIEDMLPRPDVAVDVVVPYSRGDLVSRVHADGQIDTIEYVEDGTRLRALVDAPLAAELRAADVRPPCAGSGS
ncbi:MULTISPECIES: GTPase HflX [unclassified Actinomyces]|uniref:GTPase HflX n=4 Tax=Actinomyces TaxID=1654 RepID=UPI002016E61B|nr:MULTISPECIES: GTPase HflX [unclassified Actinomyces]MCL3776684.1 GTPase HflX [Actinomyces sp. AC-20-1]MCL3789797.1 GTPase HflX [Actinomyces sp. 187325]MCL3794608.1 GTPase HflX [Actinomyces sp. 217892]